MRDVLVGLGRASMENKKKEEGMVPLDSWVRGILPTSSDTEDTPVILVNTWVKYSS